jgi:glycerate 2-kinase
MNDAKACKHLLAIYLAALDAVNGRKVVADYLQKYAYDTPLALIAIGKAAHQMATGAYDVLGNQITQSLVITKLGHLDKSLQQEDSMICLEAAHPVPDESSLVAGQTLLDFIHRLPPQLPILMLISGGTSALAEVLVPGITLSDLQKVNQWLLSSGLPIHAMNHIRKSLSAIKGGLLATHLKGHPVLNLVISDVPGDDLQIIGSGLLTGPEPFPPMSETVRVNLPDWLQTLMAKRLIAKSEDFLNIKQHLVATPALARQAAHKEAQSLGYATVNYDELIVGDAQSAGRTLAQQLISATPGIYICSSETTVNLPEKPGQGGRCQHLALSAASEFAGRNDVFLMAMGTDGDDGPYGAAGALVDGKTLERGNEKGFHAVQCLEAADSRRFLMASGDLIETGPTGTNVMDILIGLKTF